MSDLTVIGANAASMRMADALLRGVGGRSVVLRWPANAAAGSDGEQLGLSTPNFVDIALQPATFRRARPKVNTDGSANYELLVSASAVQAQMANLQLGSVGQLFNAALGIVVNGMVLGITAVTGAEAFGQIYMYRVDLHGPQGQLPL